MAIIQIKLGHHPWTIKIWLLLAVLSNANGSILFFATFLPIPFSYIFNAIYILCYRRYYHIATNDMHVAIDLGVSLIFRYVVELTSWKLAITIVFFLNMAAYSVFCYNHYGPDILRWKKLVEELNPENLRLKKLYWIGLTIVEQSIRPLSLDNWRMAVNTLCFGQSFFLVFVWFFPFDEGFFWYYQMFLGCYMVGESVVFFKCFRQMVLKTVKYQKQS